MLIRSLLSLAIATAVSVLAEEAAADIVTGAAAFEWSATEVPIVAGNTTHTLHMPSSGPIGAFSVSIDTANPSHLTVDPFAVTFPSRTGSILVPLTYFDFSGQQQTDVTISVSQPAFTLELSQPVLLPIINISATTISINRFDLAPFIKSTPSNAKGTLNLTGTLTVMDGANGPTTDDWATGNSLDNEVNFEGPDNTGFEIQIRRNSNGEVTALSPQLRLNRSTWTNGDFPQLTHLNTSFSANIDLARLHRVTSAVPEPSPIVLLGVLTSLSVAWRRTFRTQRVAVRRNV